MNQEHKKWPTILRNCLGGLLFIILINIAFCFVIFIFILAGGLLVVLEIEMIILWLIGFLFSIWFLTCPLICLFWLYRPAELFWWKHRYISHAIAYGSFLGCAAIIMAGVYFFLWFIPDGELGFKIRFFGTAVVGIIATFALWDRLYQALKQKLKVDREARIVNSVQYKKLGLCDPYRADKIFAEISRKKDEFDELWEENKLNPFQEEELTAFEHVLDKENLRVIIRKLMDARKKHKLQAFGKKTFIELIQKLKEQLEDGEEFEELEKLEEKELEAF